MPETATKPAYEAMFLMGQGATSDLDGAVNHIKSLLERVEAEIIALRKWDERRLAYEIDKQKRGVYFLCYFRADPLRMHDFERDCNLSEQILRQLIIRADHLTEEEMLAADAQRELKAEGSLRGERDEGSYED